MSALPAWWLETIILPPTWGIERLYWQLRRHTTLPILLPPANEVCEGYVFTPVCQSFCSQREGVSAPIHAGIQTPPPDQRQTHPGTRGRHPSQTRGRPNPRDQRQAPITPTPPPDQRQTPPEQCMLGDTGNKREVRILLECIRVETIVWDNERWWKTLKYFHTSLNNVQMCMRASVV